MNITKENSIRNIILQVVILQMIARSWFLYQKRCRSWNIKSNINIHLIKKQEVLRRFYFYLDADITYFT